MKTIQPTYPTNQPATFTPSPTSPTSLNPISKAPLQRRAPKIGCRSKSSPIRMGQRETCPVFPDEVRGMGNAEKKWDFWAARFSNNSGDTVDGRNSKQPPGMVLKPVNNGINYQPQLVQDFWTINSISQITNHQWWVLLSDFFSKSDV